MLRYLTISNVGQKRIRMSNGDGASSDQLLKVVCFKKRNIKKQAVFCLDI